MKLAIRNNPLLIPCVGFILGILLHSIGFKIEIGSFIFSNLAVVFAYFFIRKELHYLSPIHEIIRVSICSLFFLIVGYFSHETNAVKPIAKSFTSSTEVYLGVVQDAKSVKEKGQFSTIQISHIRRKNVFFKLSKCKANVFLFNQKKELTVGDKVLFSAKLSSIKGNPNVGDFDAGYYYQHKGVLYKTFIDESQCIKVGFEQSLASVFAKWRRFLIKKMKENLPKNVAGLGIGLILGDKALIEREQVKAFTNTGAMHVLAVSGLHVGIILIILKAVFRRFSRFITKKQALVAILILIWMYGFLTGASAAVMRAVVVFTVLTFVELSHRFQSPVNSLSLAAILLLSYDSEYLFDLGFQLSFIAMLGLFLFTKPLQNMYRPPYKWIDFLWQGTCSGLAATIATFPLLLYWFHQFPNYFIVANIGVHVLGNLALASGLAFLFSSFIPGIRWLIGFLFGLILTSLNYWVLWIDSWPGAISNGIQLSSLLCFFCYVTLLCWLFYLLFFPRMKYFVAILSVLLVSWISFDSMKINHDAKMIILNNQALQFVLKVENKAISFHESKKNEEEVFFNQNFEKYYGLPCRLVNLKDNNAIWFENKIIKVTKIKLGWSIKIDNVYYFYRQKGMPGNSKSEIYSKNIHLFQLNHSDGKSTEIVI